MSNSHSRYVAYGQYKNVMTCFDALLEQLEATTPSEWSELQRHDVRHYFEKHLTTLLAVKGIRTLPKEASQKTQEDLYLYDRPGKEL